MKEIKNTDQLVEFMREDLEFYGYRADLEPRDKLIRESQRPLRLWKESFEEYHWEPPKEIDTREWFDVHDQGPIGSCQGRALADQVEYCYMNAHGEEISISGSFAYMATQEFDGLLGGDRGSTLSGGSKAARVGLPLEKDFPEITSYRSLISAYRQKKAEILQSAPLYRLESAIALDGWESYYRWVSSFSGCVQIGISWSLGGASWEVDSYRAVGGGHSVSLVGYLPRPRWPDNLGALLKNSHSTRWGTNGWALIHPNVVSQWCRSQTVVARSDMKRPTPRIEGRDVYNESKR